MSSSSLGEHFFDTGVYANVNGSPIMLPEWIRHVPPELMFELGAIPRYNSQVKLSVLPQPRPIVEGYTELSSFMAGVNALGDDQKLQEIYKCKVNPAYFMDNYCWIRNPIKGVIHFDLFDYQRYKVLTTFINQRMMITRKFRQGGFSTVAAAFAVWMALFEREKEILIISKSEREALNIMDICLHIWYNLPSWLRCKTHGKPSKHKIFLETGSKISAFTPKAGRSFSISLLIVDEAAFVPNMDSVWADIYPTVSTGGQVFVVSTVNGIGNWYHEHYEKAKIRRSDFVPIDVHYTENPIYANTPGWVESMEKSLGTRTFRQEILAEFMGSSDTYMPYSEVKRLIDKTDLTPPMRQVPLPMSNGKVIDGALWIWEDPRPNGEYVIGSDIAPGLGDDKDYSTIQVLDSNRLRQVAEFACNEISPTDFAKIIAGLGNYYNVAQVVIERNSFGLEVINRLVDDLEYENVYYETPNRAGLTVTSKNRIVMIDQLVRAICENRLDIKSRRLAGEWLTFIWNYKSKRPEAMRKFHDDIIFATANALHVREDMVKGASAIGSDSGGDKENGVKPLFEFTSIEQNALLNSIRGASVNEEPLMPMMGGNDNDNDFDESYDVSERRRKRKAQQDDDDDWPFSVG